jgi:hypothetical protein
MLGVRTRVAGRARTGACGAHDPGCFRLHHGHHEHGDDRTPPIVSRAVGFEFTSRAEDAGEETAPPHARSGRQDSNLRSPAPETGGVAMLPYSQTRSFQHPRRESNPLLRVEGPAWSPRRPRGLEAPAAGLEPAMSRATVARLPDSTAPERGGRRGSRTPRARESHPYSRRGTAPVAVLPGVAPAGVEPATSRVRGGSSAG